MALCFDPSAFFHGEKLLLCTLLPVKREILSVLNGSLYVSRAMGYVMLHILEYAVGNLRNNQYHISVLCLNFIKEEIPS